MHLLADILGKKNTQRLNGNSVSHLLVTALLGCSALTTGSVIFNQHVAAIAQEQSVSFSISAQPLSSAIREFIATTGWQISYSSDAVAGKRSSGVSGKMSPEAALRKLISGTGLQLRKHSSTSVALLPFGSKADASDDSELLDEVVVYANTNPSNTESLFGDGDPRAIGKTTISRNLIETGGDAGGDINSQLKTLPNVQWQNDTATDAGDSSTSEQDLRPGQYSISGADVDTNLFMLDGVGVNSRGAGYDDKADLPLDEKTIDLKATYGLHSQTVYIPDAVVQTLTVQDSDISARYGGFQGGVIEAETINPTTDRWSGFASIEGTADAFAKFNIATDDGDNLYDVKPYEFLKLNGSIGVSGPIADGLSILSSFSNRYANTTREREPQFADQKDVSTNTHSMTFLNKLKLDRDWGELSVTNTTTLYDQEFESHRYLMDAPAEITGDGSSTQLSFQKDFGDIGEISNLNFESKFFMNTSKKGSIDKNNEFYALTAKPRNGDFVDGLSNICRDLPGESHIGCFYGGLGEKTQSETSLGSSFSVDGDWLEHKFSAGAGVNRIFARRERATELTFYSSSKTGTFDCISADDPACWGDEMYARSRVTYSPYETNVALTEANLWAEIELNFGNFQFRPGVRLDYENFLNNVNVAPRLKASWEATDRVIISGGFNRYYDDSMLGYALKSGDSKSVTHWRNIENGDISNELDAEGGWYYKSSKTAINYASFGLRTPYNDEYTVGVSITDPLIDGVFRIKYLHRMGEDRFAKNDAGDTLTNEGSSKYDSVSVEYAKTWSDLSFGPLNTLGFSVSASWAKRHVTNNSYFEEVELEDYIYYKGKSYTESGFDGVKGNLDIPIRGGLRLQAGLLDNRLKLWSSASFTLPYDGVIDSKENIDIEVDGTEQKHDVYVDHRYDFTTYVNAGASYQLAKTEFGETIVTAKVNNVFNEIGNATASDTNPFKKGRQFWLGLKTSF
ncbi:Secretin and TonB N terminus short domain-containing protein [Pseudovibrio ascidiaceicola]|uniref:Secretin and TonB N terminus short domain-containing protein n=1 Tax=Pseudovibrio ascidiaceicola TaxID=285279 RepID=A0A1I4FTX8_9HYPH|nr:TonB-dependent receptor [Pseudovibrio ascidiaceicola]SFL20760.1 Secretin and TonB N terminus short domain-containing protein [Pseudovibrio ascidiaceicola]